ncbi:protein trichome birefringence-like 6 isoform X2 [Hevea brasiliensis]|uniref:protein trichome birefringence-like 6 isoform X2 n=1 Tax=Hevea brasiliensis TaxID=3981 RepID=UPI0025F4CC39|nr:protein trichome birefringence-like 6 isoform X2 [Hevea brasiliensis]
MAFFLIKPQQTLTLYFRLSGTSQSHRELSKSSLRWRGREVSSSNLQDSCPLILQDASFEFNTTSLVVRTPISAQTLTGLPNNFSASGFKNSILTHTRFSIHENASGFASISIGTDNDESEKLKAEGDGDKDGVNGDFTTVQESMSVPQTSSEEGQVTRSSEKVEYEKIEGISTGKTEVSRSEKAAEETKVDSIEKIEAPRAEGIEEKKERATSVDNIVTPRKGGFEEKKVRLTKIDNIEARSKGRIIDRSTRGCDVTKGRWVYDESYPLYTSSSCPFIDEGFDCVGNGRLDKDYMKWRWQPQDCDIPRFNATRMLDLIRGKRLVFVGDSINRNQWESMLCMLMRAVRDPKMVYETHGRRITKEKGNYCFKFVDYKCTVEYYVSHFLVHESKARVGQKRVQTLRIDAIDHGSSRWRGADILIFNTAHWWSHFKTKAGTNYYQEGNQVYPRLDVSTAFRRALMTWASWVDRHINSRKTQVFFRSSSPSHFSGGQWNSGGHCEEATKPLNKILGVHVTEKNTITEDIIKQMKTPVAFLNITSLSEFRIDGHPSKYGKKPLNHYASSGQDCSHWCLPGIPDTWNELLYFHLLYKQGDSFQ